MWIGSGVSTPTFVCRDIVLLDEMLAKCRIYCQLGIGLFELTRIDVGKILLKNFVRTMLKDIVAIQVNDCQEWTLYYFKIAQTKQLFPDENKIGEIENSYEQTH